MARGPVQLNRLHRLQAGPVYPFTSLPKNLYIICKLAKIDHVGA